MHIAMFEDMDEKSAVRARTDPRTHARTHKSTGTGSNLC
jgi:hypothetical protein